MRRGEGCQAPLVPLTHGRVSEGRGIRKHRPAGGVLLVCHKELYNAAITGLDSVDARVHQVLSSGTKVLKN